MKYAHPLILSAVGAAIAISAIVGVAKASERDRHEMMPMGHGLSAVDKDADGMLSLDEYLAPKIARFGAMDANGNGVVTLEEMLAAPAPTDAMAKRMNDWLAKATDAEKSLIEARKAGHFRSMDSNSDGGVTQDEYLAVSQLRFAAMDENSDGKVDPRARGMNRYGGHHGGGDMCDKGERHDDDHHGRYERSDKDDDRD